MTVEGPVVLHSSSAAMDGGFTAVADVRGAMTTAGAADDYRLIGGVTVLPHVQRLGLDLPLRPLATLGFCESACWTVLAASTGFQPVR